MKFTTQDCQQCATDGSRVVSIHPGPFIVRVHEAKDAHICETPFRYYISVDFKYKERDALRDWTWRGYTKSEATKDANQLCAKLSQLSLSLASARIGDLRGKDILIQRLQADLNGALARYTSEVEVTAVMQ